MSDGEYTLQARDRVLGGGGLGAVVGFWAGKILVHGVAQGIAVGAGAAVGLVCPPAGLWVTGTVSTAIAVPAEALSNIVGLAAGITVGSMTGPL
jgi:hypothetical protein